MTRPQFTEEELQAKRELFLEGVRKLGTISAGLRAANKESRADRAELSRKTVKKWLEQNPEFKERYEEALAEFRDSIEERLMSRIEGGENGPTLRFKAKGEMPEKYGPRPKGGPSGEEGKEGERWEELEEKAAREDGNG